MNDLKVGGRVQRRSGKPWERRAVGTIVQIYNWARPGEPALLKAVVAWPSTMLGSTTGTQRSKIKLSALKAAEEAVAS